MIIDYSALLEAVTDVHPIKTRDELLGSSGESAGLSLVSIVFTNVTEVCNPTKLVFSKG